MKPGFGDRQEVPLREIRDSGFVKSRRADTVRLLQARGGRCPRYAHSRVKRARRSGAPESRIPNPESRRASGFTLIEMLAVIVLVAIAMAAVAISVTRGLDSARIRAASSGLAAALRYTRAQAIVHGAQETLSVDVAGHSYTPPGRPQVKLPDGMGLALTSAVADRVDNHVGRIRFFPDGSSTGGRVTLSHGQREWHVNVAWLTGSVAVVETRKGG